MARVRSVPGDWELSRRGVRGCCDISRFGNVSEYGNIADSFLAGLGVR